MCVASKWGCLLIVVHPYSSVGCVALLGVPMMPKLCRNSQSYEGRGLIQRLITGMRRGGGGRELLTSLWREWEIFCTGTTVRLEVFFLCVALLYNIYPGRHLYNTLRRQTVYSTRATTAGKLMRKRLMRKDSVRFVKYIYVRDWEVC